MPLLDFSSCLLIVVIAAVFVKIFSTQVLSDFLIYWMYISQRLEMTFDANTCTKCNVVYAMVLFWRDMWVLRACNGTFLEFQPPFHECWMACNSESKKTPQKTGKMWQIWQWETENAYLHNYFQLFFFQSLNLDCFWC